MPQMLSHEREAAVIASPKTASLYYDKILPLPGRPVHVAETIELLGLPAARVATVLAESVEECRSLIQTVQNAVRSLSEEELRERVYKKGSLGLSHPIEQAMYDASCACKIAESMELVLSELPKESPGKRRRKKTNVGNSVLVNLCNMNIVDVSKASWPQILDFRQDENARKAFIHFRDILFTSCENMSIQQLQDRLSSLVYDYELQSKKHGFETRIAAWDVLLNSQNLIKSAGAGVLGFLVSKGAAVTAIGAATTGPAAVVAASALAGTALAFDVGRALIANQRKITESEVVLGQHPANWVFLAQNALDPQSTKASEAVGAREQAGVLTRLWRAFGG